MLKPVIVAMREYYDFRDKINNERIAYERGVRLEQVKGNYSNTYADKLIDDGRKKDKDDIFKEREKLEEKMKNTFDDLKIKIDGRIRGELSENCKTALAMVNAGVISKYDKNELAALLGDDKSYYAKRMRAESVDDENFVTYETANTAYNTSRDMCERWVKEFDSRSMLHNSVLLTEKGGYLDAHNEAINSFLSE